MRSKKTRIQPTVKEDGHGPFGTLHPEDDPGFTANEYGSIPPLASEDAILADLDPNLQEALERLIIDPNELQWMGDDTRDTVLILQYGYVSMTDPDINCRELALSHRSPRVQYLWSRLNWDEIIEQNFQPLSTHLQEEYRALYNYLGKPCPVAALYRTPVVEWWYMGIDCDGYAGAGWSVRAHFRNT